jgi:hypothetical protein
MPAFAKGDLESMSASDQFFPLLNAKIAPGAVIAEQIL